MCIVVVVKSLMNVGSIHVMYMYMYTYTYTYKLRDIGSLNVHTCNDIIILVYCNAAEDHGNTLDHGSNTGRVIRKGFSVMVGVCRGVRGWEG